MGLTLKDDETLALVADVARRLGMTKTGAVRELARQKLVELDAQDSPESTRPEDNLRWLERNVWPKTAGVSVSKHEIEKKLGYDEMV